MQMKMYGFLSFVDNPRGQSLEISAFAKYLSFLYSLMQMRTPRSTEKIMVSLANVLDCKITKNSKSCNRTALHSSKVDPFPRWNMTAF